MVVKKIKDSKSTNLMVVFSIFMTISQNLYAEPKYMMTETEANLLAMTIKPGDILVNLCLPCSNGWLFASKILEVKVNKQPHFKLYQESEPEYKLYSVYVTHDPIFGSYNASISTTDKIVSASGQCLNPSQDSIVEEGPGSQCISDEGSLFSYRCTNAATIDYDYFMKDELWMNLRMVNPGSKMPDTSINSFKLSSSTWNSIKKCVDAYEKSKPKLLELVNAQTNSSNETQSKGNVHK